LSAFEEAKKEGKTFFKDVPDGTAVWDVVNKRISLPIVNISGTLKIESTASDGIEKIKKMIASVDADVLYIGAPNYRLSVKGMDYKEAERKLEKTVKSLERKAGKTECVRFERDKKK
jgi:translation initiation factor 2 subunit 1